MPIYKNNTVIKAFKGNYAPVNIYKGITKVAGWEFANVSGESISVANTYNSDCFITINGKTVETGTGIKSPTNPYALNSTANFNLVSYVENLFDQNTILPQNGWVKQSDGSFYVDVCGAVNQKILWSNVGNYTGKLSVSYKVKYKYDKTESASRGVILSIVYSDGTTSYWELAPNWATWSKEYEEYKMVTYAKPVSQIIWTYGTGSNSTWVKDIMIKKSETLAPYKAFIGNTINFPYTLRSLPNGTCDYIEIDDVTKTLKLVQNTKLTTLSSGISWTITDAKLNSAIRATHLTNTSLVGSALTSEIPVNSNHDVIYELATPIITNLNYAAIKQYYPHTNIYTESAFLPIIAPKLKIFE